VEELAEREVEGAEADATSAARAQHGREKNVREVLVFDLARESLVIEEHAVEDVGWGSGPTPLESDVCAGGQSVQVGGGITGLLRPKLARDREQSPRERCLREFWARAGARREKHERERATFHLSSSGFQSSK
jgi:hypothetical protein